MVPASDGNWEGVCAVVAAFSASTLAAMLACVSAVSLGLNFIKSDTFFLRRWGHAIAGAVILLCAWRCFLNSIGPSADLTCIYARILSAA